MAEKALSEWAKLYRTEDYWAIWLGLMVIMVTLGAFWAGGSLSSLAVTPATWTSPGQVLDDLATQGASYLVLFLAFGFIFSLSVRLMGHSLREFIPGFVMIFLGSLAVFYLSAWSLMKEADLGAPLLALILGLIVGNIKGMPSWMEASLRTEYYIKTGIVLLGATLPLTLIYTAGPVAFLQATIVSVVTWSTIYLAATRLFKLDPRFGAVLGAGGAVCGVSASIAIGGAVKADKDHIAISIAVVSIWAVVMIFSLAFFCKFMVPDPIPPGVAGAWIGTSEYADAAGFAVVAELATQHGDAPIRTFTLMKVIGRDIWIGIWAFILSFISILFWERKKDQPIKPSFGVVWERFPKFVLGFFAASIIISLISASPPPGHHGRAEMTGTFKSKASSEKYNADFADYQVPQALTSRFAIEASTKEIAFQGPMTQENLALLTAAATTKDQRVALKQLQHRSDWFESTLSPRAIKPIKSLRSWAFVFCFLCIGLSTRFKDLAIFGMKPFYAFTLGVLINIPLGYILSTVIFRSYWAAIQ